MPAIALRAAPRDFIAQEFVELSTVPTKDGDRLAPRHVDLRPFAVNDGVDDLGGSGRAHPRCASTRIDRRQLEPGRRLQGHLGARATAGRRACRSRAVRADRSRRPRAVLLRTRARTRSDLHARRAAPAATAAAGWVRVLSRIAESLFWIGRYLERAEDTARLLDVQINQLLEGTNAAEPSVTATLLSVMGVPVPPATSSTSAR